MAYFNNKQNIKGGGFIPSPVPDSPAYNPPATPSQEEGSGVDIPIPTFIGNANVTLYRNADENKVMNKRLSGAKSFNIDFKDETPVLTPRVVLESSSDLSNYNYAYIDATSRYYYCIPTLMENGLFILEMKVDPLMSHKSGIRRCIGLVERTQNTAYINKDIPNSDLITQRGTTTKIIKYGKSLSDVGKRVLILAGKPL